MGYNDSDPTNTNKPAPAAGDLIGRERIRGASRMIAEGTDAKDVSREQIDQIVADTESFRRAHKISRKTIAKSVGYSQGVISEVLEGKYLGNTAEVAIHLDNWLVEEEQRRSRPRTTQFVWTEIAKTIKATAMYCRDKQRIGMVYGPLTSGMGKTTALQAIAEVMGPRLATFITIDKVDANPTGLLKKILQSMHADDSGTNKRRFDRIVEKLRGRSHILLIDEVHNLRGATEDKPFYYLTGLHRATETTSQLWSGTSDLLTYFDRQRARNVDESLAQIRSRIFPCIDLVESLGADGTGGAPLVTVEQVKEMFAKNKLRLTTSATRFLCKICNLPDSGSVRMAVCLVEYATDIATTRQGITSIDTPLLREAMSMTMTSARATLLLGASDDTIEPAKVRTA
jgi:hypothetical protein